MTAVSDTTDLPPSDHTVPVSWLSTYGVGALGLGLVGAVFWPSGLEMSRVWLVDPNYTHGFLVPVLALICGWRIHRKGAEVLLAQVTTWEAFTGAMLVILGVCLHFTAWFLGNWPFDTVALMLTIFGLLCLVGGLRSSRAFGFPVLFLIFMAPLPIAWYQPMAIAMQQMAAGFSCFLLESFAVPAYLEGNFIHLPDYTLEVGAACSGLRQVTALLAGAVLIGHLMDHRASFRILLAVASLAIAIFANAVRIVLTGAVMMLFGKKWAEGVYHTMEGLVVAVIAMVLTLGLAVFLNWLDERKKTSGEGQPA